MRNFASFKQCAVFGLLGFALVSACSDEDDGLDDGTSGKSPGAGTSNAGTPSTAGTAAGGTAGTGSGGKSSGGAGGSKAGSAPMGGEPGDGGTPGSGGMGEGGMIGEMGGAGGATDMNPVGGDDSGGAGGSGEVPFDVLDNPGWETGTSKVDMPGWMNEGTPGAAYIEYSSPNTGFGRMGHWTMWVDANSPAYTARTFQTVEPIANGTYSFSVWVMRDWQEEQYLFARDHDMADANAEVTEDTDDAETPAGYVKITLSGIVVTSNKITVGIYTAAPAGTWSNFDDAELTLE
jgi:hypothetical protein